MQIIHVRIVEIQRGLFILMIIFHVFIISFGVSMNSMTYSTIDTLFTINNLSISFNRSNFTLAFFKAAYYANPGVERK